MSCTNVVLKKSDIKEIEMDLTGTCNLKCPLCTRNYAHAGHMLKRNVRSLEEIIAQFDQFPNLEQFYMAGTISEPTLYKQMPEFCEYLIGRGIAIELFTNANTHDEAWWARLGEIFTSNDRVYFTICGSTQELHEAYRVGSSLEQILRHHKAFVSTNHDKIDFIQHIMFDYNREDYNSHGMQEILRQFSHLKKVDTEGRRSLNKYVRDFDNSVIRPEDMREKSINALFNIKPHPDDGKKYEIRCLSIRDKKLYIDQFGRISPCYGHAEFEGPGHFSGETFDYSEVLSFKFSDCFKCEKRTQTFIDKMGLDFVC